MTDSNHNHSANPYEAPQQTARAADLQRPPLTTVLMLLFVAMLVGIATFFCIWVGVEAIASALMPNDSVAVIDAIVSLSTIAAVLLASGCYRYMIRQMQAHQQPPQPDESTASD